MASDSSRRASSKPQPIGPKQPPALAAPAPHTPYPWARVILGCIFSITLAFVGYYREFHTEVDSAVRSVQDRLFAAIWARMSPGSDAALRPYRSDLWATLHGTVLELGPGLGTSLKYVAKPAVTTYVALEPNAHFHGQLAQSAADFGFDVAYGVDETAQSTAPVFVIVNGTLDGERVPAAVAKAAPFDYVASSLVLCSVDDLEATLARVWELLAPGGKFVFVEHVRHTDSADASVEDDVERARDVGMFRMVQDYVTPVWQLFAGNCHLNRRTADAIRAMSGWADVEYRTVRKSERLIDNIAPIVYGVATKAK